MNRTDKELVAAMIIATGLFALGLYLGYDTAQVEFNQCANAPVLIWNDDDEGLPADGALIQIQETVGDTIYVGSAE
jgi:hypothetical protein